MSAQDTPRGPPPLPSAVRERAAQLFGDLRRQRREIVTPEGVPVTVQIADYGERLAAFSIDFAIWSLLTLLVYLPIFLVIGRIGGSLIAISIALFIGFVVRNLYFTYFELAWQGSNSGQARDWSARDRPPRRPALAIGGDCAKSHPRSRDVHSTGRAARGRPNGRRCNRLEFSSRPRCGCCSLPPCRRSIAIACAAAI